MTNNRDVERSIKPDSRVLPTLECPGCGNELVGSSSRTVHQFDHCARRCNACGIGFSNSKDAPRRIFREVASNVPLEIRNGLDTVLELAVNEHNRRNKAHKFGFETSEDAVTWTIFKHLYDVGLGSRAWEFFTNSEAADPIALLLWGVPLGEQPSLSAWRIREQLMAISDRLGERPRYRTEPDVVIDAGESGLLVIEVKYRSGNDRKSLPRLFDRYLGQGFAQEDLIVDSQLYELTRNWRFGWDLAGTRPLTLVNLGRRARLASGSKALDAFAKGLHLDSRHAFRVIDWSIFTDAVLPNPPAWLQDYMIDKRLRESQ